MHKMGNTILAGWLLFAGLEADPTGGSGGGGESFQHNAKRYFDAAIKMHLNNLFPPDSSSKEARIKEIRRIADLALDKMGITFVDIQVINF